MIRVASSERTSRSRSIHPYRIGGVVFRIVLRWDCATVIANIDDLAIAIWVLKVVDEFSQIVDI